MWTILKIILEIAVKWPFLANLTSPRSLVFLLPGIIWVTLKLNNANSAFFLRSENSDIPGCFGAKAQKGQYPVKK